MYTVYECIMSNIVQFKLYFYNWFIWIVLYEPVCQPYLHRENKQDGKNSMVIFFGHGWVLCKYAVLNVNS